MFLLLNELSSASGALILFMLLLIITAVVFAIKFALDIALNRTLNSMPDMQNQREEPQNKIYAIKAPSKKRQNSSRLPRYTIIPEDKLFILENPTKKDKFK